MVEKLQLLPDGEKMTFEEATAVLSGRRFGSSIRARCPAHQSKGFSLQITDHPDKECWVVHCYAGCSSEEVLSAVGMNLIDAFYGSRATGHSSGTRPASLACEDQQCLCQHRDIKADIAREKKLLAFQRHLDSEEKVVLTLPAIDWKL